MIVIHYTLKSYSTKTNSRSSNEILCVDVHPFVKTINPTHTPAITNKSTATASFILNIYNTVRKYPERIHWNQRVNKCFAVHVDHGSTYSTDVLTAHQCLPTLWIAITTVKQKMKKRRLFRWHTRRVFISHGKLDRDDYAEANAKHL